MWWVSPSGCGVPYSPPSACALLVAATSVMVGFTVKLEDREKLVKLYRSGWNEFRSWC